MKFLLGASGFGLSVVAIFFAISLGATAVQQQRSTSGVVKAAIQLALTSDARAPISKDGMSFLVRPNSLDRLKRQFQLQGWELIDESGFGYLFERDGSRMTVTTREFTQFYRVGDIKIQEAPAP